MEEQPRPGAEFRLGRRLLVGLLGGGALSLVGLRQLFAAAGYGSGGVATSTVASGGDLVTPTRPWYEYVFDTVVPTGRFRIYTVNGIPSYRRSTWKLTVDGLVQRPYQLSLRELHQQPMTREVRDFHCVTGWTVPGVTWSGVRLSHLLAQAGVAPRAGAVVFWSSDGAYVDSLTMAQALRSDVLMAYGLNGAELPVEQGAPLRLIMPAMFGYKSVKWVYRIQVVEQPIVGFWEQRGYDMDAWL
jgi:DMSO/TMAO reductase YedYZ molybdopterin-dependent catalytic subunit